MADNLPAVKLTAGVKRTRTEAEPEAPAHPVHPATRTQQRQIPTTQENLRLPSIKKRGYMQYFIEKGHNKDYLEPIITSYAQMELSATKCFNITSNVRPNEHEIQYTVIYRRIVYSNVLANLINYVSHDMVSLFTAHVQSKTGAVPEAIVEILKLDNRFGTHFNKLYSHIFSKYQSLINAAPKHQEELDIFLAKFPPRQRRNFARFTRLVHLRVFGEIMMQNQLDYIAQLFCNVLRFVDSILKNPVCQGFLPCKHKELTGTTISKNSFEIFKPHVLYIHSCVLKSMTWQFHMSDIVEQVMLTNITCSNFIKKRVQNPYQAVLDILSSMTPVPQTYHQVFKGRLPPFIAEYMMFRAEEEALSPADPPPPLNLFSTPKSTTEELDTLEFLEGIDFDKEIDLKTVIELEAEDEKATLSKAQAEYTAHKKKDIAKFINTSKTSASTREDQ